MSNGNNGRRFWRPLWVGVIGTVPVAVLLGALTWARTVDHTLVQLPAQCERNTERVQAVETRQDKSEAAILHALEKLQDGVRDIVDRLGRIEGRLNGKAP